jgi:hypothetical protein
MALQLKPAAFLKLPSQAKVKKFSTKIVITRSVLERDSMIQAHWHCGSLQYRSFGQSAASQSRCTPGCASGGGCQLPAAQEQGIRQDALASQANHIKYDRDQERSGPLGYSSLSLSIALFSTSTVAARSLK